MKSASHDEVTGIFKQFIEDQQLTGKKILLMVSGGVDSMVLLRVASQIVDPTNIAVFHLNHNVRRDAQKDFLLVKNRCHELKIAFYGETLPDKKIPQNIENQWRIARKQHAQKAAKSFGSKRILTAHHATDLVETMLFRLTKGCGIDGLSPFDITTKPFWTLPKESLIRYAKDHKCVWHEESSNTDLKYERNLIRHKVLPELRKITPNIEKVFVRESLIFNNAQAFLQHQVEAIEKPLSVKKFQSLSPILQQEYLRKKAGTAPSFSDIEDCRRWLLNNPKGGSQKQLNQTCLVIEKGIIRESLIN